MTKYTKRQVSKLAIPGLLCAGLLSSCNNQKDGINELQQQVWQEPGNPDRHISLATAYARQGQSDEAFKAFAKALELDPERAQDIYPAMGAMAFNRGDFETALDYFSRSLEFSPGDSLRLYDIGNVYFKLERYDDASAYYLQAIDNSTAFEEAYYNLAVSYIRTGRNDDALKIYAWLQEKNNYLSVSLERHLYPENNKK
ncbi:MULTISPECIES: tetratricopeptide repeat protein [Prosthecochloris]|uniref:Tetratricopeptide repeat protein n=1 Tax=Prosthecochloris vibrioformis TaxID=1098 RepID=A0A5C4S393_PROVB|nr:MULTISPECIES: tetratricopeptide repeat protein [Prosthecochloris]ANT65694.1 photosystem I assembly protein Ycf3 [Prosthecochloris sp. CIB 2401]TNJ37930.1 tetratricopeptide repeat protein [Prosthecochloris vibrioformis]